MIPKWTQAMNLGAAFYCGLDWRMLHLQNLGALAARPAEPCDAGITQSDRGALGVRDGEVCQQQAASGGMKGPR